MNMKNFLVVMAAMALMLSGCTGEKVQPIHQASDLVGKVIGDVTNAAPPEVYKTLVKEYIGGDAREVQFFNRPSDVIAAITAGKIDGAPCMSFVAEYYVKRNSGLKIVEAIKAFPVDIVMMLRAEDSLFRDSLDSAITILQENGTLDSLKETWVTNLPATNEPSNTEVFRMEGARTLYVGVSGDYTPLDYIAADGRPAGFNVALLSEISKLLHVNFELVSVETQAKFSALGSKKIDVVFSQTYSQQMASLFSEKLVMTRSYFSDKGRCFLVKKQ
jgi:polar amino acid transport system substrate-binding protein